MMQPTGEEESHGATERPLLPITLEQVMAAHLDPYINWGDGSSGREGGFSGGGEVEPMETP